MSTNDDSFNDSGRRERRSAGRPDRADKKGSDRRNDNRRDSRASTRGDRKHDRQDDRRDDRRDNRRDERSSDRRNDRPTGRPSGRPARGQDDRRDDRRDNRQESRRDDRRNDRGDNRQESRRDSRRDDRRDDRRTDRREDRRDDRRDDRRQDGRSPAGSRDRGGRPAFRPEQRDGERAFVQPGMYGARRIPDTASAWPAVKALFPPLTAETQRILELLPEALGKVWPLNAAHKRSLPDDVAQLSRLLTTERAGLARPYWSSPASISAYLYYFLPWNLVRLTRLLASLPLTDPRSGAPQGGEALLVDVGSGPLTLPLALWLARPEWRSAPVRVLAMDTSSQPLELGKTLMEVLGEITGQPVWPIRVARAPLDQVVRQAGPLLSGGRAQPWIVSAANVLNELRFGKKRSRGASAMEDEDEFDSLDAEDMDIDGTPAGEAEGEKPEGCREDKLDSFLESLSPLFDRAGSRGDAAADGSASVGPSLLFVEPGTRLGGSTIMRLRQLAVDGGLTALAPCTHQSDCPLLRGQGGRTWCHFTFDNAGAPQWLEDLSMYAGLGKSGLSLSPLLLAAVPEAEQNTSTPLVARVLSSPFVVPGLAGRARYACSGKGILLLENAERLASGDELAVTAAAGAPRDRKSGALMVSPPQQQGSAPGAERRPGGDERGQRPAPSRSGRDDRPDWKGQSDRPNRSDRQDRQGRPDQQDRPSRNDRQDRNSRQDRNDRQDRNNRQGRNDRQDRPNRQDRPGGKDRKSRGGAPGKRSGPRGGK